MLNAEGKGPYSGQSGSVRVLSPFVADWYAIWERLTTPLERPVPFCAGGARCVVNILIRA